MLSLKYTKRNKGENKEGMLKAVYYSPKEKPESIFIDSIEFEKVYRESGKSSIINLDGERKLQALVQDISYDPVKYEPIHVDFYIVEKGAKIDTEVPLEFIGVSEAVKTLGGNLVKVLHELHIEAEADKLPHKIEVDISSLIGLDSVIKVKDLVLPTGVTLYHIDPEEIVASIAIHQEEDLSAPTASVDMESVEVAEKGKKEEDTEVKTEA